MKVLLKSLLLLFCIAIFGGCAEETRVLHKDDKHNVSADLVTSTGADGDTELVVSPFCKSLRAGNRILEEKNWRNWDMAPIYGPDGSVHLFVGRWPVKGSWLKNAQIDHYKAEKPEGPYHRVGTVFKKKGVTYCNPQISKLDDRYVLVFMFKEASTPGVQQQVGLATAKSLNGPWKQSGQNPDDWQKTWHLIEAKYQDNPAYRKGSCSWDRQGGVNIDAKINAAYIVMGLLYGDGDIDKTIIISTRCGQDSDCNPSNAAGVLCTTIGFDKLPDKFKSALDPAGKFSHTPYTFGKLIEVCGQLSRQAVERQGGRVEKYPNGKEVFVILVQKPKPGKLEQVWQPGPIANSRFTPAEMKKILVKPRKIK